MVVSEAPPHQLTISATNTATGQSGIFVSQDRGVTWSFRSAHGRSTLLSHPHDANQIIALQPLSALPYVVRMERRSDTGGYVRTRGTFLDRGLSSLNGIAAARDGQTLVAVTTGESNGTVRLIQVAR